VPHISFITPEAGLIGAGILLALAAFLAGERRARRACAVLRLRPRPGTSLVADGAAFVVLGALISLAAAQPVVSSIDTSRGRADAEVVMVFDITRSMLAQSGRSGVPRLDRSRALAKEIRLGIPDVKVGVASLTDRVLPHLFPSLSPHAFSTTVDRAIGIERPPPDRRALRRATALGALPDVTRQNYFSQGVRRRVAVVFTDGETIPVGLGTLRARFLGRERTSLVFLHVWGSDERVYMANGLAEPYRADPSSQETLQQVALAADGYVFPESQPAPALATIQRLVGNGREVEQGRELSAKALSPFVAGAAFVPLVFLLRRRNF
jgi:hypothetical protein